MALYSVLIIAVLLTLGDQKAFASIKYGIEEAINDIGSVIPGSKFVLTSAVKLWLLYGEVNVLVGNVTSRNVSSQLAEFEEKLDHIDRHLDKISNQVADLSNDVKDLKHIINDKVLMDAPKKINLDKKLDEYASYRVTVESQYRIFEALNNKKLNISSTQVSNFVEAVLDNHAGELSTILDQMASLIVDTKGSYNVIDVLADEHLASTITCSKQESPLHQIGALYKDAMITEMKNLLMIQFAYSVKHSMSDGLISYDDDLFTAQTLSYSRISKIVRKVKNAMLSASQDYWNCQPKALDEGDTYIKLGPIFQKYLVNEKDIDNIRNIGKPGVCGGSCEDRTDAAENCRSKSCERHENHRCTGRLMDCKNSQSRLYACLASDNSERRYESLEILEGVDTGKIFGKKKTCSEVNKLDIKPKLSHNLAAWGSLGKKNIYCEWCFCTCVMDNNDTNIVRYFNLRDVTSDIEQKKIVTGVKFTEENNIIHIQIQQAVLGKGGNVDQKTEWKPVDKYTVQTGKDQIDFHTVTWEERTVNLDDLRANDHSVLTGLRFKKFIGGVKLEIRTTPFNFTSGELLDKDSKWISNADDISRNKNEVDLENRKLPPDFEYEYMNSQNNYYLKFTTSSMEEDIGQTVIPFIDLQEVRTELAVPLAGAGLIHKSNNDESAGFLALKLFTYNYGPHLEP